jgi:hypothetical protein
MNQQFDLNLSHGEVNSHRWSSKRTARKEEVMDNLTSLYDHFEYGEGFDGMARHVSRMSGLERMIFEDCDLAAGKVLAPHPNLTPHPYWLCPEYVARKIGCTLREAANLLDCWVILDATKEMLETFISWVKARGIEKAVAYFENLALNIAEVENIDPEDALEGSEPTYTAPDLYRYHVLGEYEDDDAETWLERQPQWYQGLIKRVRRCNDPEELAAMGKNIYQTHILFKEQPAVFWTEYNLQKARLQNAVALGPVARAMIKKIAEANGNLASVGAWLYKVQHGKVTVADPPQEREWDLIWKAYQEKKRGHDNTQLPLFA